MKSYNKKPKLWPTVDVPQGAVEGCGTQREVKGTVGSLGILIWDIERIVWEYFAVDWKEELLNRKFVEYGYTCSEMEDYSPSSLISTNPDYITTGGQVFTTRYDSRDTSWMHCYMQLEFYHYDDLCEMNCTWSYIIMGSNVGKPDQELDNL